MPRRSYTTATVGASVAFCNQQDERCGAGRVVAEGVEDAERGGPTRMSNHAMVAGSS
jgi:hypothetical protein